MIGSVTIVGVVALLIFFILREVMLWYWKVNSIIDEQKETNRLLRELISQSNKSNVKLPENSSDFSDIKQPDSNHSGRIVLYHNLGSSYNVSARIDYQEVDNIPYIDNSDNIMEDGLIVDLHPGEYQIGFYQDKAKKKVISRISFQIKVGEVIVIDPTTGVN